MNLEKIKTANTKYLGKEIIYKEEMDSTQDLAKDIAKKEFKNGTLILADKQNRGRGTQGRSWVASKANNITMTILLKKDWEIADLEGFTLKIAEAIQKAIKELYSYALTIKKPNDLLLNGKKICGILTESSVMKQKVNYVLIGIGFNVNEEIFEGELRRDSNITKERVEKNISKRRNYSKNTRTFRKSNRVLRKTKIEVLFGSSIFCDQKYSRGAIFS